MEHLTPDTAKWLDKPIQVRIDISKDKWVGHTQAKLILERLAALHHHASVDSDAKNLLIVGEPGSGKSTIVKHYAKSYQPTTKGYKFNWPILSVELADGPKEHQFYEAILDKLHSSYAPRASVKDKRAQVINLLKSNNVKLLFIDEIHHMLLGSAMQQRSFLASLKTLVNELDIPLICAGVESAHNAICLDEQVGRRFEVARLPDWSMSHEFVRLLHSFEKILVLRKPSNLIEPAMAHELLRLSSGSIGRLGRILKIAAIHAIKSGEEQITLQVLKDAHYFPLADDARGIR
jgi:replication-associated recombination protein RarA